MTSNYQRLLSYTKLLTSHVNGGRHVQALQLFTKMFNTPDLQLDAFAFPLALKSSAALRLPSPVAAVHANAVKSSLLANPFVASALVDSYGKCFSVTDARLLFDESPQRNVVVWNSMISLYTHVNDIHNALSLFELMDVAPSEASFNSIIAALAESDDGATHAVDFYRRMTGCGIKPNLITVLALLPACVGVGALHVIKEIHGFAFRNSIQLESHLGSGLVEAYGRCGCLVYARALFDRLKKRDVVDWSSMVSAYAFHGCVEIAISTFQEMEAEEVQPDNIMFLAVLKACSHAGLADDALDYFDILTKRHGVEACSDHYSCLVDVLSRAGRLKEAHDIVKQMPVKPTAKTWGAILAACRSYGDVELAEIASRALFEIEPENAGNFVLLASVYAGAGKFEEAEKVRREMVDRGVRRAAGSSWVISQK